jgi:Fe-Mn family superoxide dismutase
MGFHYGKHHKGYVDKLNAAVEGSPLASKSLVEIIRETQGKDPSLFNNAAQAWNHTFFWHSLRPEGSKPAGLVADKLNAAFGSLDKFKTDLKDAALAQFGSGWAWLMLDGDRFAITKTPNAETPITTAKKPLLTIDVWEHAYYLDYQNDRSAFVRAVLDNLLNWEFVAMNLQG